MLTVIEQKYVCLCHFWAWCLFARPLYRISDIEADYHSRQLPQLMSTSLSMTNLWIVCHSHIRFLSTQCFLSVKAWKADVINYGIARGPTTICQFLTVRTSRSRTDGILGPTSHKQRKNQFQKLYYYYRVISTFLRWI
jgi:hypothetical protein